MKSLLLSSLWALSLACLVLADGAVKKSAEKTPDTNKKATDRGNDSKPKRDASLLIGSGYHGPSYKYLPPSLGSSVYESYAPVHHGSAGGFASLGGHHHHHGSHGFAGHSSGLGHYSKHSGHSLHSVLGGGGGGSGGIKFSGVSHGFGGAAAAPSYSGGHSYTSSLGSHGYTSGHGHSGGHGFSLGHASAGHGGGHFAGGHGGINSVSSASLGPVFTSGHSSHGHGAPTYVTAGTLGGSSGGHKVITTSALPGFSLNAGHVGSAAGFATGYQYAKGLSGSGAAGSVSGGSFGSHGFAASPGFASNEIHHTDHVHNGNQEHHYVVSSAAGGVGQANAHDISGGGGADGYHYETPSSSYLTPSTQQHQAVPSSSYGVPLAAVGASYSPKFHSQASVEDSPVYAAGHKGLGHFSFTANKPNVLHTSFVDSDFKTPTYSNAPFKPSTFLGSKFEGSSFNGGESAGAGHFSPNAQYLPPSGVGAESTGYDYPAPSGGASLVGFQTSSHDNGATPIHEPESTYLPPNSLEASFNDIGSNPSANYLPPSGQSYGVPH